MLLIAIPKSASTALMETLARTHKYPCDMWRKWPGEESREFPHFHMQHSFGWELDSETANNIVLSSIIYKLHVVPSTNNQRMLMEHPKVILLRDPEEIVLAYKRGRETGVYKQKTSAFRDCVSENDWICRAKQLGLYHDLEAFKARWMIHEGDALIVHYENLVQNVQAEISRIEDYWGLPRSNTETLLRRKYTRLGNDSLRHHLETVSLWKSAGRDQ